MKTKMNVFFSSQLKKNVYEIASERRNVDFFFYHGSLDEFAKNKHMINEINSLIEKDKDSNKTNLVKIVFIIIECPLYFDSSSADEIDGFDSISKEIMNSLNWRENIIFIINNKNVRRVSYEKQIQSLTKEILINNIDSDSNQEKNIIFEEKEESLFKDNASNDNSEIKEEVVIDKKIEINDPKMIDNNEIISNEIINVEKEEKLTPTPEVQYEEVVVKKEESFKPKQVSIQKNNPTYQYIDNVDDKKIEKSKIDYDNIVWMDDNNKHLFEGKEPKTRVVYLNQMNKDLNKVIEDNSSVDEYMLENNKIKI